MSRATACFSMYSLMSMRTIAWSESNRNSASAFAVSVLPTPVGPRKTNEPMGRLGSCRPERARRTAGYAAVVIDQQEIRLPRQQLERDAVWRPVRLGFEQLRLDRVDRHDEQHDLAIRHPERCAGAGGRHRLVARQELDMAEAGAADRAEPHEPGHLAADRHRLRGELQAVLLDLAPEKPRSIIAPDQATAVTGP